MLRVAATFKHGQATRCLDGRWYLIWVEQLPLSSVQVVTFKRLGDVAGTNADLGAAEHCVSRLG